MPLRLLLTFAVKYKHRDFLKHNVATLKFLNISLISHTFYSIMQIYRNLKDNVNENIRY